MLGQEARAHGRSRAFGRPVCPSPTPTPAMMTPPCSLAIARPFISLLLSSTGTLLQRLIRPVRSCPPAPPPRCCVGFKNSLSPEEPKMIGWSCRLSLLPGQTGVRRSAGPPKLQSPGADLRCSPSVLRSFVPFHLPPPSRHQNRSPDLPGPDTTIPTLNQ